MHNRRLLRYKIMWERNPTLPTIISDAWERARPTGDLGSVATSLKGVLSSLKGWSSKTFGNVLRDIEKLQSELEALQYIMQTGHLYGRK